MKIHENTWTPPEIKQKWSLSRIQMFRKDCAFCTGAVCHASAAVLLLHASVMLLQLLQPEIFFLPKKL